MIVHSVYKNVSLRWRIKTAIDDLRMTHLGVGPLSLI